MIIKYRLCLRRWNTDHDIVEHIQLDHVIRGMSALYAIQLFAKKLDTNLTGYNIPAYHLSQTPFIKGHCVQGYYNKLGFIYAIPESIASTQLQQMPEDGSYYAKTKTIKHYG